MIDLPNIPTPTQVLAHEQRAAKEPPKSGLDQRLVRALRRLEKDWPEGYMLFSFNRTLCLYRGHPCDGGEELASFSIPTDGGDPS